MEEKYHHKEDFPVQFRYQRALCLLLMLFLMLSAMPTSFAEDTADVAVQSAPLERSTATRNGMVRVRLLSIPEGRARLERYLTEEAQKTGAVVCAGVTRERMAQYLGMNRSALSRLLGAMQREGRVELHRGWLRLLAQDAPENE